MINKYYQDIFQKNINDNLKMIYYINFKIKKFKKFLKKFYFNKYHSFNFITITEFLYNKCFLYKFNLIFIIN